MGLLTAPEIAEALRSGYELRGLEVKGPGARTDNHLFVKVTRAALSMGNLRDGGHIVIGINDSDLGAMLPGLQTAELSSWLAYEDVARKMAEYADPPLAFAARPVTLPSGATVAVIQVFPFSDIPHLCAKSYETVLRKGALYVRPRKVPETSEVASSIEMRDVLTLATDKALRAYVETAERSGLTLATRASQQQATPSDDQRYAAQRRQAWK